MTNPQQKDDDLKHVPEALARAEGFRRKGELDKALTLASHYLNDNFDHVPTLVLVANILLEAERVGLAQTVLKRVAQIDPNDPFVWNNLGVCYREGSNLEEAETHFFRALKVNPQDALAHGNLAQLYNNTGQFPLSIKHATRALQIDAGYAEAMYNRALANIALGNYKEGWADYDCILGMAKIRKERLYGMTPRWNGIEGKTIIAYGEQGIGDEIAFSACLPALAKENKVIVECNPRLWGLFNRSFGLETHGTRFEERLPWLHDQKTGMLRKTDAAVAFGSLPQYYQPSGEPYLIADPQRRIQWRALLDSLGPKLKVGISWTGGNKGTGKARRSVGLDDLLPILRQDATFISLQYMDSPEIGALERDYGIKIQHWPHGVQSEDYDDTAALVSELDLVISVTTAVIHLSGALGKPCWVMAPKSPRWFYGMTGEKLPWYKSVKLYRQKEKWVDVIAKIATDLRTLIMER